MPRILILPLLPALGAILLCACAARHTRPPSVWYPRENFAPEPEHIQHGLASYYWGRPFQRGEPTASGEWFFPWEMTAAHRRLPFNTYVNVVNLKNNRSIIVRITDRGPYVRGRIIDLSKGAAAILGMLEDGVVPVRVEVLRPIRSPAAPVRR